MFALSCRCAGKQPTTRRQNFVSMTETLLPLAQSVQGAMIATRKIGICYLSLDAIFSFRISHIRGNSSFAEENLALLYKYINVVNSGPIIMPDAAVVLSSHPTLVLWNWVYRSK